jgi:hypothetical protein
MDNQAADGANNWPETAWNGVRVKTPSTWQIGVMGRRYLLFEDDSGPTLELTWNKVRGTHTPEKQLRRLAKAHGQKYGRGLEPIEPPESWINALHGFEIHGFGWESPKVTGVGMLAFCPLCNTTSLIQFYIRDGEPDTETIDRVLADFADHRSDNRTAFVLYDVRALIPKEFSLTEHRFAPGAFQMGFSGEGLILRLHRWGPARVLLADKNLAEFARERLPLTESEFLPFRTHDHEGLEWRAAPGSVLSAYIRRYIKKPAFRQGRIWHLEEENRILSVGLEGKRMPDSRVLNVVSSHYGIIQ